MKKYTQEFKNQIKSEIAENNNMSLVDISKKYKVGYGLVKQLNKENKEDGIIRTYQYKEHIKGETLKKISQKSIENNKKRRIEKFNKKYTKEQIIQAINMLKNGEKPLNVSKTTTLTIKDIDLIRHKKIFEDLTANIDFPIFELNKIDINDKVNDYIKQDLIQNVLSIKEIANKYNVTISQVRKVQKVNNIKKVVKKKKENIKPIKSIFHCTKEQIQQIIILLLDYKVPIEVSKITKVPVSIIYRIKRKETYKEYTKNIEFPKNYKKICKNCGKEFFTKHFNSEHCSKQCKENYRIKLHTRKAICKQCGKEFITHYDKVEFCSTSCGAKFNIPITGFGTKIRPNKVWNKGVKNCFSKETLKKLSDSITQSIIEGRKKQDFRGLGGYRSDLGNDYFRSTWEANIARILKYNNIEYEFEKHKFYLEGLNRYYVPDFYLPKQNIFIEVKGYWLDDAKDKVIAFQKEYSNIKLEIIEKIKYKELIKKYSSLINYWEI